MNIVKAIKNLCSSLEISDWILQEKRPETLAKFSYFGSRIHPRESLLLVDQEKNIIYKKRKEKEKRITYYYRLKHM